MDKYEDMVSRNTNSFLGYKFREEHRNRFVSQSQAFQHTRRTCKMSHLKEMDPYFSGLRLLTVNNKASVPQKVLTFVNMVGSDSDGKVRIFDLKTELEGKYVVLIFFPMGLTFDSDEVLSLKASLESFEAEDCQVGGSSCFFAQLYFF